jgi:hypothetical protein
MIIGKKHKFVYISHQRAGSHTMFHVLKNRYGGFHYKGDGYHGRKIPNQYKKFYTFSTCRNPYSLAVSIWRVTVDGVKPRSYGAKFGVYRKVRSNNFKDFAKWLSKATRRHSHSIIMPQHLWFKGVRRLDTILHIEDIKIAVLALPFWDKSVRVGYAKNRTDRGQPHWSTYYTNPRVVDWVQQWAGPDFKKLGYSKEIPSVTS